MRGASCRPLDEQQELGIFGPGGGQGKFGQLLWCDLGTVPAGARMTFDIYVHVDDAVAGILLALEADQAVGDDFTFAGPAPYSSAKLASLLHEILGWPIENVESDWHSWTLDDSKARSVLGYRPQVDLLTYVREALAGQ